jgi:hypothetical protein
MNCDQVFDILTRGPFPTGTSCDVHVEAHLSDCADCHRLAEALRPALELFQEAVDPEEGRDLPGYFCATSAERQSPVLSYAAEYETRPIPRRLSVELEPVRPRVPAAAWRTAAMVAIGVTVGLLLSSGTADRIGLPTMDLANIKNDSAGLPPPPENSPATSQADWVELASLPAACYGRKPDQTQRYRLHDHQLLASAKLENLSCCSGCHNSASDSVPSSATMKVAQSCWHCHDQGVSRTRLTN